MLGLGQVPKICVPAPLPTFDPKVANKNTKKLIPIQDEIPFNYSVFQYASITQLGIEGLEFKPR